MDKPIFQSPPINPKDYSTYEEYREALAMRDTFYDMVEEVEKVFEKAKTEEELDEGMRALGFTSHRDNI